MVTIPAPTAKDILAMHERSRLHLRDVDDMTSGDYLVLHAQEHIGQGEHDVDNGGPYVAELFGRPYKPGTSYGNWCARFVAACLLRSGATEYASEALLMALHGRVGGGAKALCRTVAEHGRWVWRPTLLGAPVELDIMRPGDIIAWHRGPGTTWRQWWQDWRGHVEIVVDYDPATGRLHTIAGNAGRFPARVRRRWYSREQWQSKLYGVSRLG